MCGFAGMASTGDSEDNRWLENASLAMIRRGPDDSGIYWNNTKTVGLSHRRLSILDLTEHGRQPMADSHGNVIAFNGEIYNYRDLRAELIAAGFNFNSDTDTEVMLKGFDFWGLTMLQKLEGMFSFCIYEKTKRRLILARDITGQKPLYYFKDHNKIYFASELKAMLCGKFVKRRLDPKAVDCLFGLGFSPNDQSLVSGIKKVPPAHYAEFNLRDGSFSLRSYWQVVSSPKTPRKTDVSVANLETILDRSVAQQLSADVPVGVLLSGGIDSSLITALASRHKKHLNTFTVGFSDSPTHNEIDHARLISKHFNTNHVELNTDISSFSSLLEEISDFDEPIIDCSVLPTMLLSKLVSKHCKVVLSGDGADELFGGYKYYRRILKAQKLHYKFKFLNRFLSEVSLKLPLGTPGKYWLSMGESTAIAGGVNMIMHAADRHGIVKKDQYKETYAEIYIEKLGFKTDNIQEALTKTDFLSFLPNNILVKSDRSSMLSSLEMRSPFLSKEIIDVAHQLKGPQLFDDQNSKVLLKSLAKNILPREFDLNRKQGFEMPIDKWCKQGKFKNLLAELLLSKDSFFEPKRVESLIRMQKFGFRNGQRLFGMLLFELWRKKHMLEF